MEAAVCGGTAAARCSMGGTEWPVDGREARVGAAAEDARDNPWNSGCCSRADSGGEASHARPASQETVK